MPLPVIPQDAFCKNKKASTPTQKRIQLCSIQYNDLIVLAPVDGRHHGGSFKFCHSRDHHQNNIKALFINLKTVVSEKMSLLRKIPSIIVITKPKEELFCEFEFEYQMDVRTMYSKGLPSILCFASLGNN